MFDVRIPAFCTLVLARVVVVEVYLPAVQDNINVFILNLYYTTYYYGMDSSGYSLVE